MLVLSIFSQRQHLVILVGFLMNGVELLIENHIQFLDGILLEVLEVLIAIQFFGQRLEVILDFLVVVLSAIGCHLEVVDQVGVLALLKDVLVGHGDVVVVFIGEGLDVVEDDAGGIHAFEVEGVDAVVVQLLLAICLENYLEGLGLLEQSIHDVDELLYLLGVPGRQGFFLHLHEVEELDLLEQGQDVQYALSDLHVGLQASLVLVLLISNNVVLVLSHLDDQLADLQLLDVLNLQRVNFRVLDSHQHILLILPFLLVLWLRVKLVGSVDVEGIDVLQDVVLVEALLLGLAEKRVYQKFHGDPLKGALLFVYGEKGSSEPFLEDLDQRLEILLELLVGRR